LFSLCVVLKTLWWSFIFSVVVIIFVREMNFVNLFGLK